MKFREICFALSFTLVWTLGFGQEDMDTQNSPATDSKFAVHTTWLSFSNFGGGKLNTNHYEIQARYKLSTRDRIGIKATTWKLFAPMGIHLWDKRFLEESTFYPGKLQEQGIGFTYQRMLRKKLFVAIEILPLFKTYLDPDKNVLAKGFKLYSSYHVGWHLPIFKGRGFIEPQFHINHWTVDTNTPAEFAIKKVDTAKFFMFEPNLYIGFNF